MTDIALIWNDGLGGSDIATAGADLATDDGFVTDVEISLFCNRPLNPDDELPVDNGDLGGWYLDTYNEVPGDLVGSRLWKFSRSASTPDIPGEAKGIIQEALQHFIDDNVTDTIVANTWLMATGDTDELDTLAFTIDMFDDAGKPIASFKYYYNWQAQTYQRVA